MYAFVYKSGLEAPKLIVYKSWLCLYYISEKQKVFGFYLKFSDSQLKLSNWPNFARNVLKIEKFLW